jgi:acetyl-CoA acetyltransferase
MFESPFFSGQFFNHVFKASFGVSRSMEAYIVDAIRTPIGSFGGSLSSVRADDLAALVIKELVARNPQIPTDSIEDVILGCHNQAGEDNRNVARMALLLAGLPTSVPGETVNRLCASGMSAVNIAAHAIKAGNGDVFIAGGVEHMTRGPWVISKTSKPFGNDAHMFDSSFGWRFVNPLMHHMYGTDTTGATAENLVEMYNITREHQDKFAYETQMRQLKHKPPAGLRKKLCRLKSQLERMKKAFLKMMNL